MKTRLTIELTDSQMLGLENLSKELGETKVGTIRDALSLLQIAADEKKKGNRIGIIDSDGDLLKEIVGY